MPLSTRVLAWSVPAIVCVGIVGNAVQAARHGWVLEGDNAAIAINTFDTAHGHFRILGVHSSASSYAGIGDIHHPGPMLYWLAALPAGLFAWSGAGFLLFAVVVNCAAVLGAAWFVRRIAGDTVAAAMSVAAAILVWSVGSEVPHDIWNPHISVLPWFLALVLVWASLEGDVRAMPPLVAVASLCVQNHFGYASVAVPMVGVVATITVVRVWRERCGSHDVEAEGAPRRWRWLWLTALTGSVCWLPVIVQQVTGRPGNVGQLARFAVDGSPSGRRGLRFALDRLFGFLGGQQVWLNRHVDFEDFVRPASIVDVVVGLLTLGIAVAVVVHHGRRGDRRIARLLGLCLAAIALLVVSTAALPNEISSGLAYNYRPWWPVCVLTYFAIGWGVAAWIPVLDLRRWVPRGAVAATAVLALATVAMTDPVADRANWAFPAIARLPAEVRSQLPGTGPYLVVAEGGMAFLSVATPLIADLVRHGIEVQIPPEREPMLGTFRRIDRGNLAAIIVISSGEEARRLPAGSTELARIDDGPGRRSDVDPAMAFPVVVTLLTSDALDDVGLH